MSCCQNLPQPDSKTRQPDRLAASTGAACTSGIPELSHVLGAMGLSESEAASSVRFSFGRFTSNLEVREAATIVTMALQSLVETGSAPVR